MDRWQFMNDSLEHAEPERSRRGSLARRRNRIILVGARRDARKLLHHLDRASRRGMTIVGFVDAGHHRLSRPRLRGRHLAVHPRTDPVPVLGGLDRLDELVDRTRATDLVVAVPEKPRRHLLPRLAKFTKSDVTVHWVPVDGQRGPSGHPRRSVHPRPAAPRTVPGQKQPGPALVVRAHPHRPRGEAAGRFPDLRSGSRDPLPSVRDRRPGHPSDLGPADLLHPGAGRAGGRRFRIIKFRSMRADAERETGPIWASDHDSRCTRIGDWLRHTNIDELPQLFNVLRGEMSLVGPRPERPVFVEQFRQPCPTTTCGTPSPAA